MTEEINEKSFEERWYEAKVDLAVLKYENIKWLAERKEQANAN